MFEFQLSKEYKNKKVRFKYADDIEPHEALLDRLAQRKEAEMGLTGKKFEVLLPKRVLDGFFVLILILFLFLFARTFQMQVIDGEKYAARADENKFIISQIQAERGVIYDRNM
ncbi:MAG: hypothetical protein V1804_02305, partial [Patescibacteria group bacterium]